MPTEVDIPELGIVEFPDDLSESDISNEVLRLTGQQSQQPTGPRLGDIINRQPFNLDPFTRTSLPYAPPEAVVPQIDIERAQQLESEPLSAGLSEGVPSSAGITPEIVPSGRRITESILGLPREAADVFRQDTPALQALDVGTTVGSSLAKTGIGLTDYLSSPQGVTELVLSMTPAKLLVLAKWAKDMGFGAYESGKELGKVLGKTEKTPEDYQQISDLTVNALAMGLGAGFAGKRGVSEIKNLANKLNIPEGPIKLQDRGDIIRSGEEQFRLQSEANRAFESGSPFMRSEPASDPVSMGVRTQPPLSEAYDPFRATFDPSGLRMVEPEPRPVEPIRPQPAAEAATKGGDPSAVQQKAESIVRDVREPEVPKEGAAEVPPEVSSSKAPEARVAEPLPPEAAEKLRSDERLAELVDKDGNVEIVAFADKYYDWPGFGKRPAMARWKGDGWSHGVAEAGSVIREIAKPEPTVEAVTALDPASGSPLSGLESLINRLESLKYPETGEPRLFSLPHPEAIRRIGRQTWNDAVSLAQASMRGGKAVADAISDAIEFIKTKIKGFDETQIRQNIEFALGGERRSTVAPGEPLRMEAQPAAAVPTPEPATPTRTVNAGLEDVYNRFIPDTQRTSVTKAIKQAAVGTLESLRTGFSSQFRPLDKLAEDIAKTYRAAPTRIAHIFEQLKGSSGKAEADVYRFDRDVSSLVRGSEKDFNAYMFLRRSLDRLSQDLADIGRAMSGEEVAALNRRRVAGYTIPELEAKLATLESNLGPEKVQTFRNAADLYQQHLDSALRLQVESGRMSQGVYDAIKETNLFYAPFKILKYLDETSRPEGAGRNIDTVAEFTKAMKGIDDPNFKVGDMLAAGRQSITMSRILAEKNNAMRRFAAVAAQDAEGLFVRRLAEGERVPKDMETVNVLQDGKTTKYAVDPSVAEAVKAYNGPTAESISAFMRAASTPFRAGATTANIAFQPVNLLLADTPRAALVSRYGVRGAADVVRYPLDMLQSMFASMQANLLKRESRLYLDYLESGAAGSVIQDYLSPKLLKYREPGVGSAAMRFTKSVLAKPAEFARAIEETNKVLGIKRAMRFEGAESGKELAARIPEAITEVRRFSGSPDFGRIGSWTQAARLNLLFMFLNARIQGAVADVGRLTGRDGAKTAAKTWAKMMTAVGVPTAILYYYNNLPQYKADYEKRPKWEKDNYFLIPRDRFIEDENGEQIRDYWRIPKREMVQITANIIDSGLDFAHKRDPEAFSSLAMNTLENVSPVNIRGRNAQERMESSMASLNPLLKAPIEIGTGRDLFRHRDIVPDVMKDASPELQYTDKTPEIFKTLAQMMPDASPEALRSPLLLETAVRDFTANLVTQFIPQKPVKGREGIANAPLLQPLMRRFQSAPYVDTETEREAIEQLQREAADAFLNKDRAARAVIQNAKDPSEIVSTIFNSQGYSEQSIATVERAMDLWLAEKNGITREERAVLNLPVDQRASYVVQKLKGLDANSKSEFMESMVRKRIVTQAVLERMSQEQ